MENNGIKDIIRGVNFRFNKALGQNFITDSNLLDAIVADGGI
ncbi:MAG TPA: 16S rRNA (adenine(1518)-N(6)/adenine(1519)-N(6))-dimethyltransferase, partial [Clostridiales bacterium]|nr:16S rRNA (adenine(1518)-N(6)/adenine(1519)-N(6))-dimethyltransferase [Clostridiales bacterium]